MELELRQEQQLSMRQLHSLRLLQMGRLEIREYLETVAQENPTVELELPHEEEPLTRQAERWLDRWRWLEDNDRQNSYYERPNQEEEDSPMNRIGTDGGLAETLESFLCRQIAGLEVPERQRQLLYYLVGCLEDSGYLTVPTEELAAGAGVPEEELRRGIARLQTLEPAGVGAADLSQCLYLQLQRIGDDGPATQIVLHHLEALAKNRYHQIAQALHISQEEVRQAQQRIRQLDPRPGRQFSPPEPAPMVYPDVFVVEQEGEFVCDDHRRPAPMLHLNRYYQDLYRQTDDPEVKKYLAEKLVQNKQFHFSVFYVALLFLALYAGLIYLYKRRRKGIFPRRPPCPAAHVHDGGGAGTGRASVHRQPCSEGQVSPVPAGGVSFELLFLCPGPRRQRCQPPGGAAAAAGADRRGG